MADMRFLDRSSTRLVILSCGATKRPGADAWRAADPSDQHMRGFDRYDGPLWQTLRTVNPDGKLAQVAALSARYGLIHADEPILDYDARLTDELADRMIEGGLDASWPKLRQGVQRLPGAYHFASTLTDGGRRALTDVALVGGATYLRVMRAFVAEAQRRGWIAADATITEVNGPIGIMRQELRAWLGVPLQPAVELDELAGELVAQTLLPGVQARSQTERELAELERRRAFRRGAAALPAGGLFDEVAKRQGELF